MKISKIAFMTVALSLFASCNKDLIESPQLPENNIPSSISSGKYLKFENKEDFNLYLQDVKSGGNSLRALRTYAQYTPKGFKTIAELKAQKNVLRALQYGGRQESEDHLVDTEMTKSIQCAKG